LIVLDPRNPRAPATAQTVQNLDEKKTAPQKGRFNEADGTRTRNHRIDSTLWWLRPAPLHVARAVLMLQNGYVGANAEGLEVGSAFSRDAL